MALTQTTDAEGQTETAAPDPRLIVEVAAGFMAAKHLMAASALGLFEALGREDGLEAEEIARRLNVPARTARISAAAMAALGFLEADGTRYRNTPLAAAFLAGRTGADLRPFLRFWDRISYPRWDALENVLRHGTATHFDLSPEEGDIFAAGVEALTAGAARALVASHDWDRRHRLLDVGGGTGSFLLAALEAQPQLSGTVLEVEPVASVARRKLASSPHAARARVVTGDALADPLPAGHDVVLVANLAHLLSPERNRLLLSRLRAASEPGTALLLVDFWTDPTRTQPRFAALMAGEFAMFSDEGDVYSGAQVREWLAETGWGEPQERPLAGPQTLIAATAV